jgi:hydroxypyruvate isomerase
VISCYDARFDLAMRKFLKRRGVAVYDHMKIPGGAKAFAAPDRETDRDYALRMVRISLALHQAKRAILIGHTDCGAYGGATAETVVADLARAADVLRAAKLPLTLETYFADFDGIYDVPGGGTSG